MSVSELATMFQNAQALEPYVRDLHILAIMFCLFLAALADTRAAKMLFQPLNPWDVETLEHYHLLLSIGLVVLWLSGLYLVFDATGGQVSNVSPKLMAKFAVVSALTANAMLIGNFALPLMKEYECDRLGDIPFRARGVMCVMSAVSAASWMSALALGAIGQFKKMSPDALIFVFGHVYAVALLGGLVLASLAGLIAHSWQRRSPDRAGKAGMAAFDDVAMEST